MQTPTPYDGQHVSLRSALQDIAYRSPDAPALIHRERIEDPKTRTLSYRELARQMNAAGSAISAAGVLPDEAVAIIGASLPEFLCAFYAASEVAVAFPVNALLSAEALARQFQLARVRLVVVVGDATLAGLDARLTQAIDATPDIRLVVTAGAARLVPVATRPVEHIDWDAFLGRGGGDLVGGPPSSIAALFHTGGTGGSPKLAQLSRRALHAGPAFAAQQLGWRQKDRTLNLLPYFHVGGALATATGSLLAGAANVTCGALGARDPALIATLWTIISDLEITVAGLVPTSWVSVASHPIPRMPEPFRAMVTGASTMPPATRRLLIDSVGVPFCEVYGMTELAGFCSGQPLAGSLQEAGVGFWPDGVQVSLLEPFGEVAIRGPNAFSGYLTGNGTMEDPEDGFVHTGDLGAFGEAGQLVLRGRIKDVIVRSGHNIDPLAIEEVACAHPGVRQAAAVGRPDVYAGEVPALYITVEADASVPDIEAYLASHVLEAPARPRFVTVMTSLPLTIVGKLNRTRLRQLAAVDAAAQALIDHPALEIGCTDPAARQLTLMCIERPTEGQSHAITAALAPLGLSWRTPD